MPIIISLFMNHMILRKQEKTQHKMQVRTCIIHTEQHTLQAMKHITIQDKTQHINIIPHNATSHNMQQNTYITQYAAQYIAHSNTSHCNMASIHCQNGFKHKTINQQRSRIDDTTTHQQRHITTQCIQTWHKTHNRNTTQPVRLQHRATEYNRILRNTTQHNIIQQI